MNKERNNKRDWGFLEGGRYRRLRRIKCQSRRERMRKNEERLGNLMKSLMVLR
jgi:hypothetical protein